MKTHGLACALFGVVLAFTTAALAEADPPSRVARLDYMNGQVSIQPGGVDDWVAGAINRPLTTADNVWTDRDSRAEMQLGGSSLRMDAETSVTMSNVSDQTVQVAVHQGTMNLRVRRLVRGEVYEVDTPNIAFTVLKPGSYRFDVDPNANTTVVSVFQGEGEANGDGPGVRLKSHARVRFDYGKTMAHKDLGALRMDGFDDWCRVRDQREDHVVSARYVSPEVIGYEDLDYYGAWRTVPDYGPLWFPTVVAGWAPYSYGYWSWIGPWGWSWVDYAPWGFAPFHYGRWVYCGGAWGWAPGPIWARPFYAPALVGWIGGPGFGIGFGFGGGLGWFPLGFREPFYPWYGVSRGYFRQVNIYNTNVVNINNVTNNFFKHGAMVNTRYANQGVPGAVTAVSTRTFANGEPVRGSAISHFGAGAVMARPGVSPTRGSVLGPDGGVRAAAPPASLASRPVMTTRTPPARPAANPAFAANRGADGPRGQAMPNAAGPERTTPNIAANGGAQSPVRTPTPMMRGQSPAAVARPRNSPAMASAQAPASRPAPGMRSNPAAPAMQPSVPRPPANAGTAEANARPLPRPGSEVPRPTAGGWQGSPRPSQPVTSPSAARPAPQAQPVPRPAPAPQALQGPQASPRGVDAGPRPSGGNPHVPAPPRNNNAQPSTPRSGGFAQNPRTAANYVPRPPAGWIAPTRASAVPSSRALAGDVPARPYQPSSGYSRSYGSSSSGYSARSYSSPRSYGGGGSSSQAYSSPRSYGGGSYSARSYGGGGSRSYGSSHSYGGGESGGHSSGGGGARKSGGGHSGGGASGRGGR